MSITMTALPRSMPSAQRPKAPITKGTLPLDSIAIRADVLASRDRDLDPGHVQEMADTVRRGAPLDHLLVWREEDPQGTVTGRYVLLDGEHRRAAYRAAWGRAAGRKSVPVSVLTGLRVEAQLHALASNGRRKLGLTKAQRVNRGWQLCWEHGEAISKARLAGAANIGISTVGNMRQRRLVMLATGLEFTGDWSRDSGRVTPSTDQPSIDPVRQAAIDAHIRELGLLIFQKPRMFTEQHLEVAEAIFGKRALEALMDYARPYGDVDEDTTDAIKQRAHEEDPEADF